MATMPVRRLGVALLAAAVVLTTGTVSAANLNLTAPGHIGAGQQDITAPCTSVIATVLPSTVGVVYTVRLAGTGCTGNSLTVKVTLNTGTTHPVTTYPVAVAGTAINTGGTNTGPLSVDVSGSNVTVLALQSIAVLVTGS
jgi:hypothetical protein